MTPSKSALRDKLDRWGCSLVLALAAGGWLFATLRRFFSRPDAWQQVGDFFGAAGLLCVGAVVFLLLAGWADQAAERRRFASYEAHCQALCRVIPLPDGPDDAAGALAAPGAASTAECVTARVSFNGLTVTPAGGGELRHVPFESVQGLYYRFERNGEALTATAQPGDTGEIPWRRGLPEIAIVLLYSPAAAAGASDVTAPYLGLHFIALNRTGAADQRATRVFYGRIRDALAAFRDANDDSWLYRSRPILW